ncbi:hypothetical protein [Moraxella canis]|uniref:Uncharacterized protein n=1 Tax=Moraxella canis TaxID=90239 RepID=A0A1S9ZM49_9GAMM|nr:hypothetical protein [Moraxella canis]OOR84478.1 hypothetical protein B0180_02655 [Moraxella canis]
MNTPKSPPVKPKANQSNFRHSFLIILLAVIAMAGLLVVSVIYLTSHYEPTPPAQDSEAVSDLSITPLSEEEKAVLQALTEAELLESEALTEADESEAKEESAEEPSQPTVQTREADSEPDNEPKQSSATPQSSANNQAPQPQIPPPELHLPSRQVPAAAPIVDQEYINTEAAQQADLIDAEISIAINQVRKLNEQKLAAVIAERTEISAPKQTPQETGDNPSE